MQASPSQQELEVMRLSGMAARVMARECGVRHMMIDGEVMTVGEVADPSGLLPLLLAESSAQWYRLSGRYLPFTLAPDRRALLGMTVRAVPAAPASLMLPVVAQVAQSLPTKDNVPTLDPLINRWYPLLHARLQAAMPALEDKPADANG